MCLWEKVKKISKRWALLAIVVSLFTLAGNVVWQVSIKAVDNYKLDTLWDDNKEHEIFKEDISEIKWDIKAIREWQDRIKDYMVNNR